ncbi:MAG TPA: T9SS type A sorting domain-containing protein [Flavipsychrobacter sp.]|nr:T9SS type A sorting domain-containing protein [Flavipsychrobacter sp.]
MKNSILVLLFLVCSWKLYARSSPDSTCYILPFGNGNYPLDTLHFESNISVYLKLIIDTSFPGNIWQVGTVQKTGFPGAFSGTHTLQTDTLNSYPIGNESAAIVYIDSNVSTFAGNFASLSFWHYYDVDSLSDSCILQVSADSGKTWNHALNSGWQLLYYNGSLNNYSGHSWTSGSLFWSGKSAGWTKETICGEIYLVKGMILPRLYGFRFLFKSDSTETNKPGWMIDNIVSRTSVIYNSVEEKNLSQQLLYPNPSHNGIYEIDYPSQYVTGVIQLYNSFGQLVKSQPLRKQIDISQLPRGMYYYKIRFENTGQVFSGSVIYQ